MPTCKRRKIAWLEELKPCTKLPEPTLYKNSGGETLANVSEEEREFIWKWCEVRHLDDIFAVVALTYWVRARADVAVNFFFRDSYKRLYMVLCIHLALKWLGYDEENKCDFLKDLVEIEAVEPKRHQQMEIELLRALNWEM